MVPKPKSLPGVIIQIQGFYLAKSFWETNLKDSSAIFCVFTIQATSYKFDYMKFNARGFPVLIVKHTNLIK